MTFSENLLLIMQLIILQKHFTFGPCLVSTDCEKWLYVHGRLEVGLALLAWKEQ